MVLSSGLRTGNWTIWLSVALHENAVATLEIVLKLAEGGLVPGGIEDEVLAAGLCGDDAAKLG